MTLRLFELASGGCVCVWDLYYDDNFGFLGVHVNRPVEA